MKVLADTSALYTLMDEDEERHARAVAALAELSQRDDSLVTHNYVVTEACALLQRRLGMAASIRFLDDVVPLMDIAWVDRAVHDAAVAAYTVSRSAVSLVDRVSFEIMRREGMDTAFAFDDDFRRAGFRTVP